jgi:hypothetical protein
MKMVALIPARAGSKRIPATGRTRKLWRRGIRSRTPTRLRHADIEEVACSRAGRIDSGCARGSDCLHDCGGARSDVVCSDDPTDEADRERDGCAFWMREPVADEQPDIHWIRDVDPSKCGADAFAILRPTSPFRTAATIRRAYERFRKLEVHSMRAVEPVKQHPGKMWFHNGPGYPDDARL